MNKTFKKLLASSIAAFVFMGMTASAMADDQTMPYPGMMGQYQQPQGQSGTAGYGPGYGMMGYGMGPGMMGYGMGPGMMGYGMGPGMMGCGMGPGMMGGMGPGMMGYGMGPGMMGYGMGPGMMGYGMGSGMMGYGMSPGMMGGMGPGMMGGMGPGMMGGMGPGMMGYGMGPGMMGYGIDLSDAQTAKLEKIQSDLFKKQNALMSQMWSEHQKLTQLYYSEKPDAAAIGKAYSKISDLMRQALEARIDAQNKASDVYTKEQKDKMRRGFGWGMMNY